MNNKTHTIQSALPEIIAATLRPIATPFNNNHIASDLLNIFLSFKGKSNKPITRMVLACQVLGKHARYGNPRNATGYQKRYVSDSLHHSLPGDLSAGMSINFPVSKCTHLCVPCFCGGNGFAVPLHIPQIPQSQS